MFKLKYLLLCFVLISAALCEASAQDSRATVAPLGLRNVGIDQKLGAQVPIDLPFHDETGR